MKKTFISMAAAALCACALSVPAYAENVLTDKSVYLENREEMAKSVEGWTIDDKTIYPDPNTIMPVYKANIYDYAKTGTFNIETDVFVYFSDAVDQNGNYAGRLQLSLKNGSLESGSFLPSNNTSDSIAFEANAKRVNALMKERGLSTDCKEIKLVVVEGAGFAYYINNGTEKMLVAANINDVNANIFNGANGGIVVIGDELKAAADKELAAYNKYQEEFRKYCESLGLDPDAPLDIGGGYETPMFTVDNTPYLDGGDNSSTPDSKPDNPYTGSDIDKNTAVLAVELGLISAMIIGGTVVSRKRKNDR